MALMVVTVVAGNLTTAVRLGYPGEIQEPGEMEAANFEGFGSDFSDGILTWDLDLIDVEKAYGMGYDGEDIYVAVLDTGLVANWRDFFPEERIATEYGIGFYENVHYNPAKDEYTYSGIVQETTFIGKLAHGTHVTSTIIGYSYGGVEVRGVAPKAKIIPVKVLSMYEGLGGAVFGTDGMVAAGIHYVADLAISEGIEIVISMSIGGPEPSDLIEDAIDHAIENGVIVVAAAGNNGVPMGWPADPDTWFLDWPGAYPEVICVGSCGWGMGVDECGDPKYPGTGEWEPWEPTQQIPRTWWYQDVDEDIEDEITYISYFSSREYVNPAFPEYTVELDVVAPGSWILGPYPGDTFGFQHQPWWSKGRGNVPPTYWYMGGTSMSTPHVSGTCALILQANPELMQEDVEAILKGTATPLPAAILGYPFAYNWVRWSSGDIYAFLWGADATGAGIIQADAAVVAAKN